MSACQASRAQVAHLGTSGAPLVPNVQTDPCILVIVLVLGLSNERHRRPPAKALPRQSDHHRAVEQRRHGSLAGRVRSQSYHPPRGQNPSSFEMIHWRRTRGTRSDKPASPFSLCQPALGLPMLRLSTSGAWRRHDRDRLLSRLHCPRKVHTGRAQRDVSHDLWLSHHSEYHQIANHQLNSRCHQ